jgi:hypothetical protein
MFMKGEFSNRLVQVSLFSALVYYITAYPVVFESARKFFPIKFKKTHNLLIFHTFVFAVLMYLLTYFVFDPIVRVVEGADGTGGIQEGTESNPFERSVGQVTCVEGPGSVVTITDDDSSSAHCTFGSGDNASTFHFSCVDGKFSMKEKTLICGE